MKLIATMMLGLTGVLITVPASHAQDLPATQMQDHGQVVLHSAISRKMLNDSRNRRASSPANTSAEARATCANKRRLAANVGGVGHPKARRLYALCAQLGY